MLSNSIVASTAVIVASALVSVFSFLGFSLGEAILLVFLSFILFHLISFGFRVVDLLKEILKEMREKG